MIASMVAAALVAVAPAPEGGAEGWETIATDPVLIKTRSVPGSSVKEVWAEAEIAAPALDVQSALTDADHFREFMPYVKESRTLGHPQPDGSQYVYTRLDFGSLITSRDYVVRVRVERSIGPDGIGEFHNRWVAEPDRIPSRAHVIRLRVNEGSWQVVPRGPNKSFARYRCMVDPGGWIPAFAANAGNKQGVTDTFKSVEGEAQRRSAIRRQANESARR
ncbi:MAG TPA: hypothetical protein VE782_01305 [Myxococcaceae bacterium]|nr:hypothetical protein [Myxococcaceae bacterium]